MTLEKDVLDSIEQKHTHEILVLHIKTSLDDLLYLKTNLLPKLSPSEQAKILKYRVPQAAISSMAGKYLLLKGLALLGMDTIPLTDLKYGEYKRPSISDHVDFNISHSGELISCAFSKTCVVGLDIEEIKPNSISDFKIVFTPAEIQRIRGARVPILMFYRLWTQKEAVMKGDGRGFYLSPQKILLNEDIAFAEQESWHLYPLRMNAAYAAHLAVKTPEKLSITIKEVFLDR